eukprot:g201.t1
MDSSQLNPAGPGRPADWAQKYNLLRLGGLVSVQHGSNIVKTTNDLRQELIPGDIIRIGDEVSIRISHGDKVKPLKSHVGVNLVSDVSPGFVTLSAPYTGENGKNLDCYKQLLSAEAIIARVRDAAEEKRKQHKKDLEEEKKKREEAERAIKKIEEDMVKIVEEQDHPGFCQRNNSVRCSSDKDCQRNKSVGEKDCCCGVAPAKNHYCKRRPELCCEIDAHCVHKGKDEGPCLAKKRVCEKNKKRKCELDSHCEETKHLPKSSSHYLPDQSPCVDGPKNAPKNCTGTPYPGTVSVVKDSSLVTTSLDLRTSLPDETRVDIVDQSFVVTQPRDEMTLTLSQPWKGKSMSGLKICKSEEAADLLDCTPLSGCVAVIKDSRVVRTTHDLRDEIDTGEVIVIGEREGVGNKNRVEATVTNPRDHRTLTLSGPYTGATNTCVPACRRSVTWDGGLIPLCGTVTVKHGSPEVLTTCDVRDELSTGDLVRIGKETGVMTTPFTESMFTLAQNYSGMDRSGIKAYKQVREVALSGTLSVVAGSPTITTASDLRGEIAPGDMIKIYQRPGDPDLFAVVAPQNSFTLTIARNHPGPTASGLKGYKSFGTLNPLSGFVSVTKGSTFVATTMDLSGEIVVGDHLRIDDTTVVVAVVNPPNPNAPKKQTEKGPVAPQGFNMEVVWPERTADNLRVYRVGKSANQLTLEELAREKLKCTSIYCLAKIEQLERGLPFAYPRILKAGAYGSAQEKRVVGAGRMRDPMEGRDDLPGAQGAQ